MKLPSDDDNSSLEDDASVSDFNLPGHAPDDEEQIALVATSDVNVHVSQKGSFEGSSQKTTSPFSSKERSNQRRKRCFLGLVAVVVVALSMVLATRMAGEAAEESNEELSDELSLLSESESAEYSESGSESSASSQGSLLNQVVCPLEPPPTSDNDKPGNFDEYIKADKTKLTEKGALAESTENYRNEVYDGFGLPYEQAKADISNYITEYFVPPLRRNGGGSIYESACGTAANLLMTLVQRRRNLSTAKQAKRSIERFSSWPRRNQIACVPTNSHHKSNRRCRRCRNRLKSIQDSERCGGRSQPNDFRSCKISV